MSVIKMTDLDLAGKRVFIRADLNLSLIHISEPTRPSHISRMPSSA